MQVPPLFLDVHSDHFVLDSKQLLVHQVLFVVFTSSSSICLVWTAKFQCF